jgi:predicted permease
MTRDEEWRPPRLARTLVRLALPRDRFEAIDGDLAELFELRASTDGVRAARARYWRDAASILIRYRRWSKSLSGDAQARARSTPTPHQIGLSLRGLARQPGFSAITILTLALGIGATTTVFTVARAFLSHPELAHGQDDLVMVWGTNRVAGQMRDVVSGPTFLDLQRENRALAGLSAFHFNDVTLRGRDRATVVGALEVTAEFFEVTGIRPTLGRTFARSDTASNARIVLLSHGFWQRQFGGDPQVIGRSIDTTDGQLAIVGVLPETFRFFFVPDLVTLIRPETMAAEDRSYYFYWLVGRLESGAALAEADQDLNRVMAGVAAAHAAARGWEITTERLETVLDEPVRPTIRVALFTALLVLAVACANVAGLVLTRHVSRRRELAVRVSLGASRRRVFFELLADSVWLAAAGAVAGVAVALGSLAALDQLLPPSIAIAGSAGSIAVPRLDADVSALGCAALIAMATVVACGVGPAWRTSRLDTSARLDLSSRGSTTSVHELRLQDGLVSLEMALATTTLVIALLLVQTVGRLNAIDPGFRGQGVLAMTIGRVDDLSASARARYYTDVLRRVMQVPGVNQSALNDYVLLSNEDDYEGVEIEGQPRLASGQWPREEWRRVSSEYFRTLRIPVVRGRDFTPQDTADAPSVVVINEAMARKYWPGIDPVGRRLRLTAGPYGWSEVVGIVGDVREVGLDQPAKPMMFVPYHRGARPVMALFARVNSTSDAMVQSIQQAVWSVDSTRPVFGVQRVDRLITDSMAVRRLAERVAAAAALLALALTAVGIYCTLSYAVSQRRRELAVRVAIGAQKRHIAWVVLRQVVAPTVAGLAAGLAGALAAAALTRDELYGVSPFDPWTYGAGAVIVLAAALVACTVPARRASSVDPMTSLRAG